MRHHVRGDDPLQERFHTTLVLFILVRQIFTGDGYWIAKLEAPSFDDKVTRVFDRTIRYFARICPCLPDPDSILDAVHALRPAMSEVVV